MKVDNDSKNEKLSSYISYYKDLNNPKYAVLVKGEWGVGKTHLINNLLKQDEKFYISLFGLTTIQEVHSAVFVKMYPTRSLARKFLSWLGNSSMKANDFTLTFGPLISNVANALIKEKVDNSKPIVFDDLERCSIKLEDLFGVFNKYVEHHGCKVIVIAHDDKLNTDLTDKKEKIFGQIIKVSPDIDGAFESFIQKSKTPYAFDSIKEIVYKSFVASECKSLRVLDYIINDCSRLLSCIPDYLRKNKYLLSEAFTLFTALNINYRLGKVSEKEIETRNSVFYYVSKNKNGTKDIFDEIKENYKKNETPLNMDSDLLSNEILVETIVNGLYNKQSIIECINASRHFMKAERKGPWYTIMNFDSIETHKVNKALDELYLKFEQLEIVERGEILHSINLLFMLSEEKHIKESFEEIFTFFLNYIKKLQTHNKLPPSDSFANNGFLSDSAYGYGFWIKDSYKHYSRKLIKVLNDQEYISLRKKYPSYLLELKNNLKENTPLFCDKISRNGLKEINKFGYFGILSAFKPHEFVDMWLSINISDWHKVRMALVNRYSGGAIHNDLEEEGPWLKQVKMNIRHRASKTSGIDRLRISRLLMEL
ncbi:P-loop NTPase fold protein [Enterobacter bugandensis]|uniref:P-loop NTPase fold protein n=1 Tax=Enterobacter bugandensis TaxID=881260 RepID=UPI002DBBA6A5|nr:P-loop NTPase fold protein [Enterobacter bugandensis]WRU09695.1 P-loop NTPase fold protein [Enterobacter bugandensis]